MLLFIVVREEVYFSPRYIVLTSNIQNRVH